MTIARIASLQRALSLIVFLDREFSASYPGFLSSAGMLRLLDSLLFLFEYRDDSFEDGGFAFLNPPAHVVRSVDNRPMSRLFRGDNRRVDFGSGSKALEKIHGFIFKLL